MPNGSKAISVMWTINMKRTILDKIVRFFWACVVARGDKHRPGNYYMETYIHVTHMATVPNIYSCV